MNEGNAETDEWTRKRMLAALQADVNAWPQRVRDAGVTKLDGSAYVPVARNIAILRTPDDPEATLHSMVAAWEAPDGDKGSDGWYRIIAQAGPELTWEWLMVDETKPYRSLFSDDLRARASDALDRDPGTAEWRRRQDAREQADKERAENIARLREQYRNGEARRPAFPELDSGLRRPLGGRD